MKKLKIMDQPEIISGECNTDFQPAESLFSTVPPIVRKLTKGFSSKKWSSHNEPVPIPSKSEVEKLLFMGNSPLISFYKISDNKFIISNLDGRLIPISFT